MLIELSDGVVKKATSTDMRKTIVKVFADVIRAKGKGRDANDLLSRFKWFSNLYYYTLVKEWKVVSTNLVNLQDSSKKSKELVGLDTSLLKKLNQWEITPPKLLSWHFISETLKTLITKSAWKWLLFMTLRRELWEILLPIAKLRKYVLIKATGKIW